MGSLLGVLLLGAGLWVWSAQRRDECSAWLGGDRHAPASQVVQTGSRTIVVPCKDWLPRQPAVVQMLCVLTVAGLGMLVISLWADWKKERTW